MYVDDSQIYHSFDFANVDQPVDDINKDLNIIQDLFGKHALQVDPSKSCATISIIPNCLR